VDVTGTPTPLPRGLPAAESALWFEIRPNLKRSAVIAGDILAALGKRRDVAGKGRNEHEDVALVLAWLHAYDISALVATEAQNLARLTLRHLVTVAKAAGLPLWLLHRPPRSDDFYRDLTRVRAHPMRYSDIPPPRVRETKTGERPALGLDLTSAPPLDRFRTTLRRTLPADSYALLESTYADTFTRCDDTLDRDGASIDVIANLVEGVTASAPLDDALIVGVRALQLAAWHHDTYVKTDIPALLASSERPLVDPITIDETLVAYRQPHRAVVVALAAQQVGVLATLEITVGDARDDGVHLRDGRVAVLGEHTSRACQAQVELRRRDGATASDPLFRLTDRAVSTALNQAALDFGIAVHGRRAERHVHPRRWLARLGITVTDLP
jgi:hypothetical protein